jgi:membrane-bound metal-dependent hydrolase YbcI (DUF457 family)
VAEPLQCMAAAFIHYFLGVGLAYLFGYSGLEALIVGLLGAIQDLDFISFFLYGRIMKMKYSRLLMHRGLTHTVLFAVVCSAVLLVNPGFSLLIFANFILHIFTDYVTAWGVSPFLPFSNKRYTLGLMTIFDIPLIILSVCVAGAGFFSVSPLWFFAAFFGYICLRFVLKKRLHHNELVPMGNFVYAFCYPENDYRVGKVDILGREEVLYVKKYESDIDVTVLDKIKSKIEGSMLSHFVEYPVYNVEGDSIRIKDARSYLFPGSNRFGFTLFFDQVSEQLYVLAARRKMEIPS